MKSYLIKFYEKDGTIIRVLRESCQTNEITFTSRINAGVGELQLNIRTDFDKKGENEEALQLLNFVRVYEIDEEHMNGRLIYTGYVSGLCPYLTGKTEGIRVTVSGLATLLGLSQYSASYVSPGVDPAQMAKDIIDSVNTNFGHTWLSYAGGYVEDVGYNVPLVLGNMTWMQAMEKVRLLMGEKGYFFIDGAGELHYAKKPTELTYRLVVGREISEFSADETTEDIVNNLTFQYDGGSVTVSDATSIATYGERKKVIKDYGFQTYGSAEYAANARLEELKDPIVRTRITLNVRRDFVGIHPGQTVRVLGTEYGPMFLGGNLQIVSTTYRPDGMDLELEREQSEIGKGVDRIFGNL